MLIRFYENIKDKEGINGYFRESPDMRRVRQNKHSMGRVSSTPDNSRVHCSFSAMEMLKLYLWFSLKTVTNQRREPDPLGFKCIWTTPEKQSKRVEPKTRWPLSDPSLHAEGQLQLKVLNEPVPSVLIRAWHFLFSSNEAIPRHQHTQAELWSMSHSRQKTSNAENRGWRNAREVIQGPTTCSGTAHWGWFSGQSFQWDRSWEKEKLCVKRMGSSMYKVSIGNQAWWCRFLIPALVGWTQEDQEFKASLDHMRASPPKRAQDIAQ